MHKIILVFVSIILMLTAALCGCGQSVVEPTYTQPIAVAMLQALNTGDYPGYISHLSQDMKEKMTENDFITLSSFCEEQLGQYESCEVNDVSVADNQTTVVYKVQYSLAADVIVTVGFMDYGGESLVNDFYMDSFRLEPIYSPLITAAMLQALTSNDYQSYCLYISQDMAIRTTTDIFKSFQKFYQQTIGDYVSLHFEDIKVEATKTTVTYKAKYSIVDQVAITVIFIPVNGSIAVDGLFLYAPEMVN
jgi:hypothetical protein